MAEVLVHQGDYILIRQMDGDFVITQTMDGEFGKFMAFGGTGTPYTGEYVVIPRSFEQSLETAQRYLLEDVTVRKIPYFETSNESGTTVYIGTV